VAAGVNRFVKADWSTAILVCSRCSRRLGGGFGIKGKQTLAKALRNRLGHRRWRRPRIAIVQVKCLGVCPRGGVAVANAMTPGEPRVAYPGDDPCSVVSALGIAPVYA